MDDVEGRTFNWLMVDGFSGSQDSARESAPSGRSWPERGGSLGKDEHDQTL